MVIDEVGVTQGGTLSICVTGPQPVASDNIKWLIPALKEIAKLSAGEHRHVVDAASAHDH